MPSDRGGKRPGAGAPALHGEPMKRINVMLDDATVRRARDIGDGNLSAGIRRAVMQQPPSRGTTGEP